MQAVINTDDDDLNGFDDPEHRPGWFARFVAWLSRPLAPLANAALRHRADVEAARHAKQLEDERKKRRRAEVETDAAKQKAETLAKMHAEIVAMLEAQIAAHNAAAKRSKES